MTSGRTNQQRPPKSELYQKYLSKDPSEILGLGKYARQDSLANTNTKQNSSQEQCSKASGAQTPQGSQRQKSSLPSTLTGRIQ